MIVAEPPFYHYDVERETTKRNKNVLPSIHPNKILFVSLAAL